MKILIADDQPMVVEDLLDELSELSPKAMCLGTSDPSEIISLFKEYSFDIVFMDIDLAGKNGIELAAKLLEIKPRTNIIYITGYEKFALESYKTVTSAFLVKPVSTEMLKKALATLRFPVSDITDEILEAQYSGGNMIGLKLTKYREQSGLTQKELADKMNITVQTVYRWERGERLPDIITFMHIAKVLGINAEKLICF